MTENKAVALKYSEGDSAPLIAASARGFLAKKMLEIAEKEKVPIVKDKMLADVLTVQEIGAVVPQGTWEALAKIFAYVMKVESEYANVKKN